MSLRFYDQDGRPIEYCTWAQRLENLSEWRVAQDDVIGPNEKTYRVSTVWLGLDHQFGDGPPLIFETMVFFDRDAVAQFRMSTSEQAHAVHQCVVAQLQAGVEPENLSSSI